MTEERTFELKPPKSALERLISAVTLQGLKIEDDGRGGIAELTTGDWMAALSGSGHPIGEAVICLRYLGHNAVRPRVCQALDYWGWLKLRERGRRLTRISAAEHRAMAAVAVAEYCERKRLTRERKMQVIGIGRGRWDKLQGHYADLVGCMVNGEAVALEHMVRQLRD